MPAGVNVRTSPTAAIERGAPVPGKPGSDGDSFADLLTGAISVPGETAGAEAEVAGTDPQIAGVTATPEGEAGATGLPTMSIALLQSMPGAQAILTGRLKVKLTDDGEVESQAPNRPLAIGDLAVRLGQLEQMLKKPKDGKGDATAKGDEKAANTDKKDKDSVDTPAVSQAATAAPVATSAPAATPSDVVIALQTAAPVAEPKPTQAAPVASDDGTAKATAQAITAQTQPTVQLAAADQQQPAKKTIDLSSFEPVKPFQLPSAVQALARDALAGVTGQHGADGKAKTPLAALVQAFVQQSGDDTANTSFGGAPSSPTDLVQALTQQADTRFASTGSTTAAVDNGQLGIDRQLDIAKDSQWLDRLAKDIAATGGQDASLKFKLHPESLGTLHVELAQSHAGTSVRLTADTDAARSIIADAQPRLLAEARAQGVRIADAHVGTHAQSQNGEQRRQEASRQDGFLRTAAATPETESADSSSMAADERFA